MSRSTARSFLQACIQQGWIAGHGLILQSAFVDEALHWIRLELVRMHTLASAVWHRPTRGKDLTNASHCKKLTEARHVDPTLAMVHSFRLTGLN